MIISILKKIKILIVLFPAILLLLYCDDQEDLIRQRAASRQKGVDAIRSTQSDNHYGRYNASDYDGPDCENLDKEDKDYEKCMEICDKVYDKQSRRCEELPVKLIFDLDKLFTEMQRIRDGSDSLSRRVSDLNFGVMIDIDVAPALILIRDWSQREVTEFLIWTAKTSSVALALVHHDKENAILEAAFERLGEDVGGSSARLEYGIGKDLQSFGQTFWALAEKEKNQAAFVSLHRLVMEICSSEDCKLRLYCIREESTDRLRRQRCHYSSERRSFSRSNHCYIHGPDVWSYWEELNKEREFRDSDFPVDAQMNEDECDRVCQTENCGRN